MLNSSFSPASSIDSLSARSVVGVVEGELGGGADAGAEVGDAAPEHGVADRLAERLVLRTETRRPHRLNQRADLFVADFLAVVVAERPDIADRVAEHRILAAEREPEPAVRGAVADGGRPGVAERADHRVDLAPALAVEAADSMEGLREISHRIGEAEPLPTDSRSPRELLPAAVPLRPPEREKVTTRRAGNSRVFRLTDAPLKSPN